MFHSINPATGAILKSFEPASERHVEATLAAAVLAQRHWVKASISERAKLLNRVGKLLRDSVSKLAPTITAEMGKPIGEAEGEILKCAWCCEFYAENAAKFLEVEQTASGASESYVALDPLGVVLAIMPWNYPFWQLIRFAAPALAAGNAIVLKHAANVPQCAAAFEQLLLEAGAPVGLASNLFLESSRVEGLIDDPRIAAVTLTGSTQVGSIVAAQAGRQLKKQVLELGGSDPFIVLADADIAAAAQTGVKARFQNTGQSCIAAKRFIVEDSVADEFSAAFCKHVAALRVGDPMDRETTIGPMARENLCAELQALVDRSVAAGAIVRAGGKRLNRPGYFFEPTVLDHVTSAMASFAEETFGPVAAIVRAHDADHAIELANATEFGLGAAIWTADIERARGLARRIEAGAVFINGLVASDPRLPFGGVKKSGYGRELGIYGLREFTNIKTVWIGPARAA